MVKSPSSHKMWTTRLNLAKLSTTKRIHKRTSLNWKRSKHLTTDCSKSHSISQIRLKTWHKEGQRLTQGTTKWQFRFHLTPFRSSKVLMMRIRNEIVAQGAEMPQLHWDHLRKLRMIRESLVKIWDNQATSIQLEIPSSLHKGKASSCSRLWRTSRRIKEKLKSKII